MARRESPTSESTETKTSVRRRVVDFDIQQQLAQLQELIYDSFRIPLTAWSVIDEDRILDQIDLIADSIPESIQKALAIIDQEERIMTQAEEYAQRIIQSAQQDAARILDETGIIQHAQQESQKIRHQVQQECEALQLQTQQECEALQRQTSQECDTLQRQTLGELDQIRQVTTQEVQQYRQQTVRECQELQRDADKYADDVLTRLENNIAEMLRSVGNCRQILYDNSPDYTPASANSPAKAIASNTNNSPPRPERPRKQRSR